MLLKSDWFAIVIATLGAAVVVWHGLNARDEYPAMKKIIYGLLGLVLALWIMILYVTFGLE
jgi:bacteriorhodopsin